MLNSRNIDDLRPDVAAACRYGLNLCKEQGLNVLVTGTVRDNEYQEQCYKNGTAKTKIPSFHSIKAGLAFDFCKNIKGQEYSDTAFFKNVAAIFKSLGFEWGGDWKSFVDMPHLQWSGYKYEYTSAMIIAGKYPPTLVIKEDEEMTQAEFNKMMDIYLKERAAQPVHSSLKTEFEDAKKAGIVDGARPRDFATRDEVAVMIRRAVK